MGIIIEIAVKKDKTSEDLVKKTKSLAQYVPTAPVSRLAIQEISNLRVLDGKTLHPVRSDRMSFQH